ncbi:type 4b pilus protein PilO2 [Burkholderia gladioli]|uniref:type 4b pilus protein PilO2 n=1 Tax=Burkholderia gladioli TaxID=28095 RepID=UPI00163FB777|nr:type 4b pilus protein PilO2 [Burkholderia gladioli]
MTIEILSIPGVRATVAVGLTWIHTAKRPSAAERRKIANRGGAWGVVRRAASDAYQIGHGVLRGTQKPRRSASSLAALVADHHRSPWLGLYRIDEDRSWLIAVTHDGQIIPDGDRFGEHEALLRERDALRAQQQWREEDGDVGELVTMIALATPQPKLRDLTHSFSRPLAIGTVTALAFALAAAGAYYWQQKRGAADLQEHLRELAAAQRVARERAAAEAAIPPWTRQPPPAAVFAACANAWDRQLKGKLGWIVSGWTCTPVSASVLIAASWTRSGGLAADAPGRLTDADHSLDAWQAPATLVAANTTAVLAPEAHRAIWTFAQTYPISLSLEDIAAEAPKATSTPESVPPPWERQSAHFTLSTPPWAGLAEAFNTVPGLRITSVRFDDSRNAWTVDATLYSWRKA